jgi:hypothetical protein
MLKDELRHAKLSTTGRKDDLMGRLHDPCKLHPREGDDDDGGDGETGKEGDDNCDMVTKVAASTGGGIDDITKSIIATMDDDATFASDHTIRDTQPGPKLQSIQESQHEPSKFQSIRDAQQEPKLHSIRRSHLRHPKFQFVGDAQQEPKFNPSRNPSNTPSFNPLETPSENPISFPSMNLSKKTPASSNPLEMPSKNPSLIHPQIPAIPQVAIRQRCPTRNQVPIYPRKQHLKFNPSEIPSLDPKFQSLLRPKFQSIRESQQDPKFQSIGDNPPGPQVPTFAPTEVPIHPNPLEIPCSNPSSNPYVNPSGKDNSCYVIICFMY